MFKNVGTNFLTLYKNNWILEHYSHTFSSLMFYLWFQAKIRVTTLIQSYLKSYASTWWKKVKPKNARNNGYSWKKFNDRIKLQFIPKKSNYILKCQFWNLGNYCVIIHNSMWKRTSNSCHRSFTCMSLIRCVNLWWDFQLGPNWNFRKIGMLNC
jgi:hypothetical protein